MLPGSTEAILKGFADLPAPGALLALQILGINVQPLLAVGGVSGIAIGFGAQSVSANAITGINLVSQHCLTGVSDTP